MAKLSQKEVEHIAHLARIQLSDEEVEKLQEQLSAVIDYNANLLGEVDVTGIEPTAQTTGLQNVWRNDEIEPSLPTELAISQARSSRDGQFKVKKVLGES